MTVFFANLAPCVIGMEACGAAHQWARTLKSLGHSDIFAPTTPARTRGQEQSTHPRAIARRVHSTIRDGVAHCIARLRSRADDGDAATVVERHGAVGEHAPLGVPRQDDRFDQRGRHAACASSSALQASSQPRASRNTRSSAKPISEIVMIDAYMVAVCRVR